MNFTYRRKRQRLIIKNKSSFSGRLVFSSAEKCHSILVFLLLMGSDMSLSLLRDNTLCVCVRVFVTWIGFRADCCRLVLTKALRFPQTDVALQMAFPA